MRFGNLKHTGREFCNLGDQLQLIAMDLIYERMGISKSNLFYIDKNELLDYKGENIILPINMPLADIYDISEISPNITPVFLGLSMQKSYLTDNEIRYLKKFEPIGCRNYKTYSVIHSYGIKSYLGGCVTVTFPLRAPQMLSAPKVYIVDASEELMAHVPVSIRENAIYLSHKVWLSPGTPVNVKELAWERYELYKRSAGLVITSLLHCAVPCLAAGIPVVFAKDTLSYRFGFCDKLVKIYEKDEYSNVDWAPASVYFEDLKELVYQVVSNRLNHNQCESDILKLHNFYMDYDRKDYPFDFWPEIQQYLLTHWTDHSYPYEYAIWGLCELGVETIHYIKREYPNAVLRHIYDKYRAKTFENIRSSYPDEITNDDETVLVMIPGAHEEAQKLFKKIGKNKETYFFI